MDMQLPPPLPLEFTRRRTKSVEAWFIAAAGLTLVVGAFMPWITANSVFVSISRSGLDYQDGFITGAIGVGLVILGALIATGHDFGRKADVVVRVTMILAPLVAFLVLLYDRSQIQQRLDSIADIPAVVAQVGSGLWLSFVGAVVGFAAAVILAARS